VMRSGFFLQFCSVRIAGQCFSPLAPLFTTISVGRPEMG
jgi:hypothetical protein